MLAMAIGLAKELTVSLMTFQGLFLRQTTTIASGKLSFQERRYRTSLNKCLTMGMSNNKTALSCRTIANLE